MVANVGPICPQRPVASAIVLGHSGFTAILVGRKMTLVGWSRPRLEETLVGMVIGGCEPASATGDAAAASATGDAASMTGDAAAASVTGDAEAASGTGALLALASDRAEDGGASR
ncbi:MAG: hypothetical protein JWO36_3402 [Myxococcales bacterium]|nr:hypothetical protein [Myxococcales bacterium]